MPDSVLIVGCGVFGLSTALELAKKGYEVTAIDAYAVPSPWSAACDFNKIIRTEYDTLEYTKIAVEAQKLWRSDELYKDCYNECGRILVTPELHKGRTEYERQSIKNLHALGEGLKIEIFKGGKLLAEKFDLLKYNTVEPTVELKWNPECALGHAANALKAVYNEAASLGVRFIFGKKGQAVKIVVKDQIEYVETVDGTLHTADKIILSSGAQTGKIIDMKLQQAATGLFVTHIRLTEEEYEKYKDMPIVFDSDMGYFFPPDPATNILKIALPGSGAQNYVDSPFGDKKSLPRYKLQHPEDTMPLTCVAEGKRILAKYLPELAYHTLFDHKACWIADTADSNFIIDDVPGYKKVMVASGDSGHAFKLLPNIGMYIVKRLEGTLDKKLCEFWRWKEDLEEFDPTKCEWRVVSESLDFSQIDWAPKSVAERISKI